MVWQYFAEDLSAGEDPFDLCDFVRDESDGLLVLGDVFKDLGNSLVAGDSLDLFGIQFLIVDDFEVE